MACNCVERLLSLNAWGGTPPNRRETKVTEYFRLDNYEVYCEKHLPEELPTIVDRLSAADVELQEEGNVDNWNIPNACHVCCEFASLHVFCSEVCHEIWCAENGIWFISHIPTANAVGKNCAHCFEVVE